MEILELPHHLREGLQKSPDKVASFGCKAAARSASNGLREQQPLRQFLVATATVRLSLRSHRLFAQRT